jgi:hypothetical protein
MNVSSWSDGEWWLLLVRFSPRGDRLPASGPIYYGSFLDGRSPIERMLPGSPECADPPAAHPAELKPMSSYGDLVALVSQEPLDVGDELLAELPQEDRPPAVTAEEWAAATVADAPAAVTERFGRALEPTVSLKNAGLYWIEKPTYPTPKRCWLSEAAVRWQLGVGKLLLTVIPKGALLTMPHAEAMVKVGDHSIKDVAEELPALVGEYGQRVVLVPNSKEKVGTTHWQVMSPQPDTMVGWDGDIRVGDTPWGKCRVYYHPCVLHVVFDL